MRLTVSNHSFEYLDLEGTLALARAIGFKGVDIAGFHDRGRCSLEPDEVGADPLGHANRLNRMLAKYELEAVDFFPQFGASLEERSFNAPDPAVRKRNRTSFEGIIRFCEAVGIPGFTISPGTHHPGRSFEENLDTAVEAMNDLTDLASERDITVRFEPHVQSVVDTPERALALLERAPEATVTLDYSHFVMQYIPEDRIHPLLARTDHFHIRAARPGKLQSRLDENTIDFVDIARRLEALDYRGCLSIEFVYMTWFDCNRVDCLTETIFTKDLMQPHVPV
ncbi:MAG: sugar phosphate isomerase/epimerase [Gemmatimonadetes bacterium]|nr:sugar phosphate isomerase/epimerase [Gemmatimonadota bacterium]MYG86480.1 sugar phosphate isomerase/epimerase [Gemmatimonadota bacterium]MYJ89936.1 sugar phosphate isomerase/epimerase [Gemmatimonadota bacterium]